MAAVTLIGRWPANAMLDALKAQQQHDRLGVDDAMPGKGLHPSAKSSLWFGCSGAPGGRWTRRSNTTVGQRPSRGQGRRCTVHGSCLRRVQTPRLRGWSSTTTSSSHVLPRSRWPGRGAHAPSHDSRPVSVAATTRSCSASTPLPMPRRPACRRARPSTSFFTPPRPACSTWTGASCVPAAAARTEASGGSSRSTHTAHATCVRSDPTPTWTPSSRLASR